VKKNIEVVAAVIYRIVDEKKQIFTAQRGYGDLKGGWEFPGGKIEKNETREQALVREIQEEFHTKIQVKKFIHTVEYEYPSFYLKMHVFACQLISGELELLEHDDTRWIFMDEINSVDWLPADRLVIESEAFQNEN